MLIETANRKVPTSVFSATSITVMTNMLGIASMLTFVVLTLIVAMPVIIGRRDSKSGKLNAL